MSPWQPGCLLEIRGFPSLSHDSFGNLMFLIILSNLNANKYNPIIN
jgi:hypothetical protein